MKKKLLTLLSALAVCVVIAFMMMPAADRIRPGVASAEVPPGQPAAMAQARLETIPEYYEAVGTVRPVLETQMESRISSRVLEVLVSPGMEVKPDQTLIVMDDREFKSRVEQAEQVAAAAQADFQRTQADYQRYQKLFETKAVSASNLDAARTAFLTAQAALNQADRRIEEARTALSYTRIQAMEAGQVSERFVEPGDMAFPGKVLLKIQTSKALRLEAVVREGVMQKVLPGTELEVYIDARGASYQGRVDEVVPTADPRTRSFVVKVTLGPAAGVMPGMFGRLRVPVGERRMVTVPKAAIRRIGQLEVVTIKADGRWTDQYVRTGNAVGERVEILSGLNGDETLAVPETR